LPQLSRGPLGSRTNLIAFKNISLILLSLLVSPGEGFGQSGPRLNNRRSIIAPGYIVAKSDSIIISITGPDFFRRNFTLIKDGIFPKDDDPDAPAAFGFGKYYMANYYPDNVVYSTLYRFRIGGKDWIDEPIRLDYDSSGHLLHGIPLGIPEYLHHPNSCTFNIDEDSALAIARQTRFQEGHGPWKIGFGWIRWGGIKKYAWAIDNCLTSGYQPSSNGESIFIDANSGVILQKSTWVVTP